MEGLAHVLPTGERQQGSRLWTSSQALPCGSHAWHVSYQSNVCRSLSLSLSYTHATQFKWLGNLLFGLLGHVQVSIQSGLSTYNLARVLQRLELHPQAGYLSDYLLPQKSFCKLEFGEFIRTKSSINKIEFLKTSQIK